MFEDMCGGMFIDDLETACQESVNEYLKKLGFTHHDDSSLYLVKKLSMDEGKNDFLKEMTS